MKKPAYIALIVVTGLLPAPANVMALSVIDLDPGDLNSIVSQDPNAPSPTHHVVEDYNETGLVPYPSHDGMAIVQPDVPPDVPPEEMWFDKIVEYRLTEDALLTGGDKIVTFEVLNTTPYVWSDYHIEFWDSGFTQHLDFTNALIDQSGGLFLNSSFDGQVVEFWAPDWQSPAETNTIAIHLDMLEVAFGVPGLTPDGSFGIRQVATTTIIPEPLTMAGVFLGIAGLARYVKRRKA